jgi:hypothetical protein
MKMRVIADWLALLGGVRPPRRRTVIGSLALGVWWAVLFAVILATIGRATKFIYVDF